MSGNERASVELLSAQDVSRTIARIAHQFIEKTALDEGQGSSPADAPRVVLLGIPSGGVPLAQRIAAAIEEFSGGSEDKCVEFEHAKPGMLGLETSLAIINQVFVEPGLADWRFVAKLMSERPAEILRLTDQGRPIVVGEPANLTLVNPDAPWTVHGAELKSKASNTPYEDLEFSARVGLTLLRGAVTYQANA